MRLSVFFAMPEGDIAPSTALIEPRLNGAILHGGATTPTKPENQAKKKGPEGPKTAMRGQGNYFTAANSGYASMPHSLRSAPSYSSSSETRRPMTILITKKAIAEVTKTQPKIVNAPMI